MWLYDKYLGLYDNGESFITIYHTYIRIIFLPILIVKNTYHHDNDNIFHQNNHIIVIIRLYSPYICLSIVFYACLRAITIYLCKFLRHLNFTNFMDEMCSVKI